MKNEEEAIREVCEEAIEVLQSNWPGRWEVVVVSDGSTDGTDAILEELMAGQPAVRAFHIAPGRGQSAAMEAGFRKARAPILATMDGDGQNDPADLPRLMEERARRGVDMMCGIRARRSDSGLRRFSSRVANGVRSRLLGDHITDVGCSIRVFRRSAALRLPLFLNFHRFFPALMQIRGYTVAEIPVNHRPRLRGRSKYGAGIRKRLFAGIVDLIGVIWLKRRALRYRLKRLGD